MIRQLTKCIREYKAPTIWTLVLILAEVGECRLPLVRMSDDKIEKLKASMNALGLIK